MMKDFLSERERGEGSRVVFEIKREDFLAYSTILVQNTIEEFKKEYPIRVVEEYLTREEAAKELKVCVTTLYYWDKKGILNPYRIGNKVLYKRSDIDKSLIAINGED